MCQVKGLNSIVKCRGAKVGSTGGVSLGARVNGGLWSIVVDVCGEGCLLGILTASTSLLATMSSAASLSLGRSISAHTTIGPALLLLLGELGVSWLVLHSAKLIFLGALTASTRRGAFLLKREYSSLDDPVRLQVFDLIRRHLAEYLSYNLHSGRELAKDNHCLHRGRELKVSVFQVGEVAKQLRNHGSGMGASGNVGGEKLTKLSIG